jgi:YD repeat-containing protein
MRDNYGLRSGEYKLVLSKVYNQSVTIKGNWVYNTNGKLIYYESSDGNWIKKEYDINGNEIYSEDSNGDWYKYEYDSNGKVIYSENSDGDWYKYEYDSNGNIIYQEDSYGFIEDNR